MYVVYASEISIVSGQALPSGDVINYDNAQPVFICEALTVSWAAKVAAEKGVRIINKPKLIAINSDGTLVFEGNSPRTSGLMEPINIGYFFLSEHSYQTQLRHAKTIADMLSTEV